MENAPRDANLVYKNKWQRWLCKSSGHVAEAAAGLEGGNGRKTREIKSCQEKKGAVKPL